MPELSQTTNGGAPLTVSVEVAGALLGIGRQSAYAAMWRGELPVIGFGGRRKYVLVARLAERVGRQITASDIDRALAVVEARKRVATAP